MSNLFVNAPIQNSTFSFQQRPHKLVGLRIATILNELGENRSTTDLWNVARLAGDTEFKETADGRPSRADRLAYERAKIAQRYHEAGEPRDYMLDADPEVLLLAKTLVQQGLSIGVLHIQAEPNHVCLACNYFTGTAPTCPSCSSERIGTARHNRLYASREPQQPIFGPRDLYGSIDAKYVTDIAGHRPNPLAISTRRDLGVPLDDFDLAGQVLNPQAGLLTTALAAGTTAGVDQVTMLITAGDAIKIAAYGQHFTQTNDCRLRYALHGRIPYDHVLDTYEPDRMAWADEHLYRTWFLPLQALRSQHPIPNEQIHPLRKFLHRLLTRRASDPSQNASESHTEVSQQVRNGSLTWVSNKQLLRSVVP